MKILFFVSAFIGFVYLVVQSGPGQAWLDKTSKQVTGFTEVEVNAENTPSALDSLSDEVAKLNMEKQQLNDRISTLEDSVNELTRRLAEHSTPAVLKSTSTNVSLTQVADTNVAPINQTSPAMSAPVNMKSTQDNQRLEQQARLQDVINKMELASLSLLTQ